MTGSDPMARRPDCGNDAAPFVLDALEPAEARAFAQHVESCAVCRDEVAALAPVLDVLSASVPRHDVSDALRRRVMEAVRAEPRTSSARPRPRRRWRPHAAPTLAGALAASLALGIALVIALAIGAGPGVLGSGRAPARVIQASIGHAQLRIAGGHGELIVDHLPPAPPNRIYELWLQRGSGKPAPSTLFAVTSRGTAVLGVPGDLARVTRVLVTVEPSGGSRVPTTPAVIAARV